MFCRALWSLSTAECHKNTAAVGNSTHNNAVYTSYYIIIVTTYKLATTGTSGDTIVIIAQLDTIVSIDIDFTV